MRSTHFNEGDPGDENDYREPYKPQTEPDNTLTTEELEELFHGK